MDNQQIAHDLAIAKMYGSDLPAEKLVEQYAISFPIPPAILSSLPYQQYLQPKLLKFEQRHKSCHKTA